MDQQATRLKFGVENIGAEVLRAETAAQIAGRCSVFAKSDMIHAQQRGYSPAEVLRGLCDAVARNFRSVVTRGKQVIPPVLVAGGVSWNAGMLKALRETFDLAENDILVPDTACWLGAIGAALHALDCPPISRAAMHRIEQDDFPDAPPLSLDNVILLRDRVTPYSYPPGNDPIPAWLGIDIGSVSTNLVVIDEHGAIITDIYTRTNARPIEVVAEGLRELERRTGGRLDIRGVGTTGSGRELIGILIGADTINDEITAHKTGALHISRSMLGREVDTIFEIGGQDSKYISVEGDVVVDFAMNDACAAGTGSFLEEQAEALDIAIKDDFARMALSSCHPVRMGERCTVFMGRDVNAFQQRGAHREDIIAGLAYSVVHNYLNRVVGRRPIGETVFFQGGTAYNDAVAAAFAQVSGKTIIVPPHNGVMGAVGEALLAKRRTDATGRSSSFRGWDLSLVEYSLKEFTCKHCTNYCTVQEFTVGGEKTYWGDKCSERYRKRKRIEKKPVIPDLTLLRDRLLTASDGDGTADRASIGTTVGIPLALYTYDRLPFYETYLKECGFRVVRSDPTNAAIARMGSAAIVAEPCWPVTVAHGHVQHLFDRGVDYIWLPNTINAETNRPDLESHVCVWGSTIPFVVGHAPSFSEQRTRMLSPTLHFREGKARIGHELHETVAPLGISRRTSDRALAIGLEAQDVFRRELLSAGKSALETLRATGERAIVLVGRPYNIYDRAVNLSVAGKLATIYGINVIPFDFLDTTDICIDAVNDNMYWNYGRRILETAVALAAQPQFDLIYLTNFKCGPDSFVKQYIREAIGRPFLVLQFDGHSNDAGMMTRCEAYLDSKGFLGV